LFVLGQLSLGSVRVDLCGDPGPSGLSVEEACQGLA